MSDRPRPLPNWRLELPAGAVGRASLLPLSGGGPAFGRVECLSRQGRSVLPRRWWPAASPQLNRDALGSTHDTDDCKRS